MQSYDCDSVSQGSPHFKSMQTLPLSLLNRLEAAGLTIDPVPKKKMALRWAAQVGDLAEAEQLLQ